MNSLVTNPPLAHGYVGKDLDASMIAITLPEEYGIIRVNIQPRTDNAGSSLKQPRVLVSNVEPSKLNGYSSQNVLQLLFL